MDVFIEQCITIKNDENKENINIYKNQQKPQQNQPIKVVFELGPDKKNEYNLVEFKRWGF
jgi:hypothetical protein